MIFTFADSLREWQHKNGYQCTCGSGFNSYKHGRSCQLLATVREWREQCHIAHEEMRDRFDKLVQTSEVNWTRLTKKDIEDREQQLASHV